MRLYADYTSLKKQPDYPEDGPVCERCSKALAYGAKYIIYGSLVLCEECLKEMPVSELIELLDMNTLELIEALSLDFREVYHSL